MLSLYTCTGLGIQPPTTLLFCSTLCAAGLLPWQPLLPCVYCCAKLPSSNGWDDGGCFSSTARLCGQASSLTRIADLVGCVGLVVFVCGFHSHTQLEPTHLTRSSFVHQYSHVPNTATPAKVWRSQALVKCGVGTHDSLSFPRQVRHVLISCTVCQLGYARLGMSFFSVFVNVTHSWFGQRPGLVVYLHSFISDWWQL